MVKQFHVYKLEGKHANDSITSTHQFRNPSVMIKIVNKLGIDEHGSNYNPDVYTPVGFDKDDYIDRLLVAQQEYKRVQQNKSDAQTHE